MSFYIIVLLIFFLSSFNSAPTSCRTCHCNANATLLNSTEIDLLMEVDNVGTRHRRDTEVELRACSRFQIEMLLIPLSIAVIPIALCALFLCTCCCGPKDSRGKLPEDFLANFPMSKKKRLSSEELELEFRDGYVQRKDSSKTKFSTTVSYIEARRESLWSMRSAASENGLNMTSEVKKDEVPQFKPLETMEKESNEANISIGELRTIRLKKIPSQDSIKRTRFSDTVSVISVESLQRI